LTFQQKAENQVKLVADSTATVRIGMMKMQSTSYEWVVCWIQSLDLCLQQWVTKDYVLDFEDFENPQGA